MVYDTGKIIEHTKSAIGNLNRTEPTKNEKRTKQK